jgi:hypothetical protein
MYKLFAAVAPVVALVGCACHHAATTTTTAAAAATGTEIASNLVACPTGRSIGEVPSCGKVWKLSSGSATLNKAGQLDVQVRGLVLDDASTGQYNGTPDGVDAVAAALMCDGKVVAQTQPVPLSPAGDASIRASFPVSSCSSPKIVLRERYEGKIGGWLAATSM